MNDLRPEDEDAFAAAALEIGGCILVRGTNETSLKSIPDRLCIPKPIDCKAKTADQGPLTCLLVDPVENPKTSSDDRRAKAAEWIGVLHGRYTAERDKASPFHGCVRLGGQRVHGDYDLRGIALPGQDARRGPKFDDVQNFVSTCHQKTHGPARHRG